MIMFKNIRGTLWALPKWNKKYVLKIWQPNNGVENAKVYSLVISS